MNNFDMMYYSRCDYLSNIEETIRVALEEDYIDVFS